MTGTGKLLRRKAGQSHNLEHKSPKRKRAFSKDQPVAEGNDRVVRRMLGIPGVKKAQPKKAQPTREKKVGSS
ncbi:MAG TPA: bL35 family ribosomal protein [Gaiellaceae bacterium]|nr:bL35 family ribosomal protein [Gaiellaceae bacterium]